MVSGNKQLKEPMKKAKQAHSGSLDWISHFCEQSRPKQVLMGISWQDVERLEQEKEAYKEEITGVEICTTAAGNTLGYLSCFLTNR